MPCLTSATDRCGSCAGRRPASTSAPLCSRYARALFSPLSEPAFILCPRPLFSSARALFTPLRLRLFIDWVVLPAYARCWTPLFHVPLVSFSLFSQLGGPIEALLQQEKQTIDDLLCAQYTKYLDKDVLDAGGSKRGLGNLSARSYHTISTNPGVEDI